MKNAKNIQKITTSLFLAATLVLGSVSFAVPGIMPSAFAATENLYVSADNKLFDKSFNGPMVIEIVVNDNDIDEPNDLEPDVTVNGATLKMIQAGDGNWYAYIAQSDRIADAVTMEFFTNGTNLDSDFSTSDADAIYADDEDENTPSIIRQSKTAENGETGWPVIQAFDFAVDGDVSISYSKGGNPQSVTLTFLDDPDDYASLSLDRSSYPAGADVHMTITSLAHNIDPTDEDSWTYDTRSGNVTYQNFTENGIGQSGIQLSLDNLSTLTFDDSGILKIITQLNDVNILEFQNNTDQRILTETANASSLVTILETEPNSGIFKNTDDGDKANIKITDNAPRGYTAVIDFADSPISIPVRNYPGSLAMDVNGIGGTWNGGEEITVTLDDGDLNLNSLVDQDIELDNWNTKVPTVIIGTPLTLETATFWADGRLTTTTYNSDGIAAPNPVTVTENVIAPFVNGVDLEIDPFSHRAMISQFTPIITANVTDDSVDPPGRIITVLDAPGLDVNIALDTFDDGFDTNEYYYYIHDTVNGEEGILQPLSANEYPFTTSITLIDGESQIHMIDIFRFGQSADKIESAATTRSADAIYRMLLEETGDNTAMYTGSIEYTALNQLNVRNPETYNNLAIVDDEITIIVPTDLTDEDAVRVDYLDTDGEGIATQIGDQVDAPTHSGIVSFDGSNYKVADTVTVTLTDADLNTDSDTTEVYTLAADSVNGDRIGEMGTDVSQSGRLLDITFDDATWTYMGCESSDDDGLSNTGFTLSETTSTSGIFTGTFQIPATYCTSDTESSTTTGKDLEVNYVDYSDASGELIEVGDSAGISANTGSVSFDRSVYPVPFDPTTYSTQNADDTISSVDSSITGETVLHIRVNDPDYDVSGSGSDTLPADKVTVKLVRGSLTSSNLATDDAAIKEISPASGIFELDLSLGHEFTCEKTDPDDMCTFTVDPYRIQQGDIVTVEYTDDTDASGNLNTVTDSATFDLRNAVLQTDKSAYIIGGDMILTLIEPDFDLDSDETESYPLDLIEWDSDADILAMGQSANFDPEPSALRETGDSTGIFQVVIEIPEKLPDGTGEALERGEQIDLEYIDYGPAGADYVGNDDEDIELTVFTSNFGATVSLDKKVYSWTDKVFITITAPDHNFDSDLIDEIGDTRDDPVKISTRENSIDYYRLVETGTDTGIFTGEVILTGFAHNADGEGLDDAPTQSTTSDVDRDNPAGPTDGYLEAEDVDGITVSFEVSEDDTVIGSAIIRWNIGEIEWAEASYPASGNGLVRIVDPDLNLNPESVDNFDVDVWSDSDPGGISLTVTETNEATGVFEGQVSFTTNDESSGHRLRVAEGDTITAEYARC